MVYTFPVLIHLYSNTLLSLSGLLLKGDSIVLMQYLIFQIYLRIFFPVRKNQVKKDSDDG